MATITTIAAGDTITSSRTVLNTNFSNLNSDKMETSVLDTDTALAANSDSKVATQKATKAYVDAATGAVFAAGIFTKLLSDTTTTTIAHGLGAAPRMVRISGVMHTGDNPLTRTGAYTVYTGSTQYSWSYKTVDNVSGAGSAAMTQTFSLNALVGTITVDATNITIAWAGSGAGTANLVWEAQK